MSILGWERMSMLDAYRKDLFIYRAIILVTDRTNQREYRRTCMLGLHAHICLWINLFNSFHRNCVQSLQRMSESTRMIFRIEVIVEFFQIARYEIIRVKGIYHNHTSILLRNRNYQPLQEWEILHLAKWIMHVVCTYKCTVWWVSRNIALDLPSCLYMLIAMLIYFQVRLVFWTVPGNENATENPWFLKTFS